MSRTSMVFGEPFRESLQLFEILCMSTSGESTKFQMFLIACISADAVLSLTSTKNIILRVYY